MLPPIIGDLVYVVEPTVRSSLGIRAVLEEVDVRWNSVQERAHGTVVGGMVVEENGDEGLHKTHRRCKSVGILTQWGRCKYGFSGVC